MSDELDRVLPEEPDGGGRPAPDDEALSLPDEVDGDEAAAAPPPLTDGPPTAEENVSPAPILTPRRKGRRLAKPAAKDRTPTHTPEQRLLLLDTWLRSGLPAKDFAALVGLSAHTLYSWKKRFAEHGPEGLMDRPRGRPKGSRLPEITKRSILMLKEQNPEWGCERISDMLRRGPALPASPGAVGKVLKEAGYEFVEAATRPHPDKPRRFERAQSNQLWQTDLFTFVLKRQNRRVYLVAFMDDHSRFIVGYGLHASQSAGLVMEVFRQAIASHQPPEEVLTDNGSQYVTWRGKSAFSKACEKRGIKQIVAKPRRPQTLGKIERFWGTLWRECVETAVFLDLGDARTRIGHFIDHYNFQRVHRGIDGLVPADRFFHAAPDVLRTLKERVAANALQLARDGTPKEPFYLTGQVGGKPFSVHAEGERVILTREGGAREEIELVAPDVDRAYSSMTPVDGEEKTDPSADEGDSPAAPLCPQGLVEGPETGHEAPAAPGVSPLDEILPPLAAAQDTPNPTKETNDGKDHDTATGE